MTSAPSLRDLLGDDASAVAVEPGGTARVARAVFRGVKPGCRRGR